MPSSPVPIKELRSPVPIKELRSPVPIKELRSPVPIKELRSPVPVKELRSPVAVKEGKEGNVVPAQGLLPPSLDEDQVPILHAVTRAYRLEKT